MPHKNGYEAALEIREMCTYMQVKQPYIVGCTGHTEQEYLRLAWESQIDEVMPKPVSIQNVQTVLNEHIVFSYEWNNFIIL